MKEIFEAYKKSNAEAKAKADEIASKIEAKKKKVERLERSIEKLQEQIPEGLSWYDGIVVPLAEKLSEFTGLEYVIYGPFGIGAETSIYLVKDKKISITKQATKGITLRPHFKENGEPQLTYWNGQVSNEYRKGTLGEVNGFNHIHEPLPDTIDEILKILRSREVIE